MDYITSRQNPLFKKFLSIKERKQEGCFLVEGKRWIERAESSGWKIKEKIPPFSKELVAKLSYRGQEDADLAVFEKKPFLSIDQSLHLLQKNKTPLVLVIDPLEKPGNLGAILRSADGAGVDLVCLVEGGSSLFHPNVICAAMGALFSLPIFCSSKESIQALLQKAAVALVVCDPEKGKAHFMIEMNRPIAFVFGREDCGIDSFWMEKASYFLKIPMAGCCDSLNVSVSAGVVLYEALRQRS